jgi:hypothetical protein
MPCVNPWKRFVTRAIGQSEERFEKRLRNNASFFWYLLSVMATLAISGVVLAFTSRPVGWRVFFGAAAVTYALGDTSGRFPWPRLPPTDVQAYYAIAGGLVQGDQLLAM